MIEGFKAEKGLRNVEFSNEEKFTYNYVDSVYLITSTLSTVGYGDYKGFVDEDGGWAPEMIYLAFVTFTGLLLFSLLLDKVLNTRKLKTV